LDLEPLLDCVLALSKKSDLISDSLLEWLDESHGVPLIESHDRFLEFLLNLDDVSSENCWFVRMGKFTAHNLELSSLTGGASIPESDKFVELSLELSLLVSLI
jgi:hypothetical protein